MVDTVEKKHAFWIVIVDIFSLKQARQNGRSVKRLFEHTNNSEWLNGYTLIMAPNTPTTSRGRQ
jgi:hypothetical protein